MASVTRKRSFFIGLALTGFRPRIVSITKRAIWQANSTLPVWISVKNARRRVLADTGLPVCGLRMSWRMCSCGIPRVVKSLTRSQRIGPAAAGVHAHTRKQTRVERYPRRKSPSTEAKAGIGELQWVLEHAVEGDPRAGIHPQRGIAALVKYVMRRDVGAHRQVDGVDKEGELPVASLRRPHERSPVEMRQQLEDADVGIHFRRAL